MVKLRIRKFSKKYFINVEVNKILQRTKILHISIKTNDDKL